MVILGWGGDTLCYNDCLCLESKNSEWKTLLIRFLGLGGAQL